MMQNMKLRGFVRVFLFGCLAVCGLEALATGGVAGRPCPIDGGFTYYYGDTRGNTPNNPNNIYGQIPKQSDFTPRMGETNAIYLSRTASFRVSAEYEFHGTKSYDDPAVTKEGGNKSHSDGMQPDNIWYDDLWWTQQTDGGMLFKASNAIEVNPSSNPDSAAKPMSPVLCYFIRKSDGARGLVQVNFLSRSDNFYRVPRSDTYYVVPETELWFCRFSDTTGPRWLKENGTPWDPASSYDDGENWSCRAANGYDRFTVKAPADTTFELVKEYGSCTVTVHVVSSDFKFESKLLFFKGTNEVRKLSTILYECNVGYDETQVKSVKSADQSQIEVKEIAGDWTLQAMEFYDVDREVVVTFDDGNVLLLKITSVTGRCDETLCAGVPPKIVRNPHFENLIQNNDGSLMQCGKWLDADMSNPNIPPGYPYVKYHPSCVLYNGQRYSVFIACKEDYFTSKDGDEDPPNAGHLWCILALKKVVAWIEDLNGNMFKSPVLCIGNVGYSQLNEWRFCLGAANTLYTDDENLVPTEYIGTKVSAEDKFQGVTPDVYGYCALLADAQMTRTPINKYCRDEVTVFLISDAKPMEVRKEVIGGNPDDRFLFEAIYDDSLKTRVTNHFSIAAGETYSFMTVTGGMVRVREIVHDDGRYIASARMDGFGNFAKTNVLEDLNVMEGHVFEFRNVSAADQTPLSLWITDHADAGDGKVHLAFDPTFQDPEASLSVWFEAAKNLDAVHVACAPDAADLEHAPVTNVLYRDDETSRRDLKEKHWAWITADTQGMTNNPALYWKIKVDEMPDSFANYRDKVLSTSAPTNSLRRYTGAEVGESGVDTYVFTNLDATAEVRMNRASRLKKVLLVGGGGAGGGATGGGGGGGEVKLVDGKAFGRLEVGNTIWIDIGKGGQAFANAPSKGRRSEETIIGTTPGNNGKETRIAIGTNVVSALGGGGGGSLHSSTSDYPGDPGRGRDGANGGGSVRYAVNGGQATVPGGHNGGGGIVFAGNGHAGGGGGMGGSGQNASGGQSGRGGEGLRLFIPGVGFETYGSGGGGGANVTAKYGEGGTHAGCGGIYKGSDEHPDAFGQPGDPGFGGGGGGGSYVDVDFVYPGGSGGDGTVILVFQDVSEFDAECDVTVTTPVEAVFTAKVTLMGDGTGKARVKGWYAKRGGAETNVIVDVEAEVGETVSRTVSDLEPNADYDYGYVFTDSTGERTLESKGSFSTDIQAFFDCSANVDPSSISFDESSGEYVLAFTKCVTNAQVTLKRPMTFKRGLVVGGGGAGGSGNSGGGGGGGQVVEIDEERVLDKDMTFTIDVGEGGTTTSGARNNNGGTSILDFAMHYEAIGGGAGASGEGRNVTPVKGLDGGNGGGAVGTAAGGQSSVGGHAGGSGCTRSDYANINEVPGGGGGAAADGGAAERNSTLDLAGNGGMGIANDITGSSEVYGSGGGGGSSGHMKAGTGGPNAGDGGQYQSEGGTNPTAGKDGFGGGGGGSQFNAKSGGRGGCGAVIFRLRTGE